MSYPGKEQVKTSDELTKVFRDRSIFDASDQDLARYLRHLGSEHVPNDMVRHREMNRCLVINTIQTRRFIESVEKTNQKFTKIILGLTVLTIALSGISIWQSLSSGHQTERLIATQEMRTEQQRQYFETQIAEQKQQFQQNTDKQSTLIEGLQTELARRNSIPKVHP